MAKLFFHLDDNFFSDYIIFDQFSILFVCHFIGVTANERVYIVTYFVHTIQFLLQGCSLVCLVFIVLSCNIILSQHFFKPITRLNLRRLTHGDAVWGVNACLLLQ